jgi:uncharacterized protein (TIGR03086 family)
MSAENLDRAVAATAPVIDAVDVEQLALPSPCASWTVGDIINHIVDAQGFFAGAVGGEVAAVDATADPHGAFHAVTAASRSAFAAEGAMERTVTMPFGEMPGSAVVNLAAGDLFVHGWDIARATGQSTDLDAELAERLLANARGMLPPEARGPDGEAAFGPEQQAPAGACAADRLAAFMGRTV